MVYAKLQAIRDMAGVQNLKVNEAPIGVVDGVNRTFFVSKLPLVDTRYSDAVAAADVAARVNGAVVTVQAINAATGEITLETAPAEGSIVAMTYAYSSVSDVRANEVRTEAESWLNTRISTAHPDYTQPSFVIPGVFSTITTLFSAGLILIRDYGSSADTDLASKDGYKKLQLAREMLSEYLGDVADDSGAADAVIASIATDGNIFRRDTDLTNQGALTADAEFFNKDN